MFLSCSQLVARDGHVRPDLVLRILSPRVRRIVEMVNCLVAIAFSAGLAWYGTRVVTEAYTFDDRSTGILSFPMWIYDLALPIAGVLMAVRYIIRFVEFGWRFDPERMKFSPAGHE
jgi:C4-dicarboxylate transporter DctQ subunit